MGKKNALALAVVCGVFVFAGLLIAADATNRGTDQKVVYVCNCGETCTCGSGVSTAPGMCDCGKTLAPMHVLKIEGNAAYLCNCGKDCSCGVSDRDLSRCDCGRPVKKVAMVLNDPCGTCPNKTEGCQKARAEGKAGCEKCDKPCGKMQVSSGETVSR